MTLRGKTAPSDPGHADELLDHIANLSDEQVDTIRKALVQWEAAATDRPENATGPEGFVPTLCYQCPNRTPKSST